MNADKPGFLILLAVNFISAYSFSSGDVIFTNLHPLMSEDKVPDNLLPLQVED